MRNKLSGEAMEKEEEKKIDSKKLFCLAEPSDKRSHSSVKRRTFCLLIVGGWPAFIIMAGEVWSLASS